MLFKTLDLGIGIGGAMEGLNEGGTTRTNTDKRPGIFYILKLTNC